MTLEEELPPRFIAEDRLSGVRQSDLLSGGLGTRRSSTTLRELLGVETTLGLDVHVEDVSAPSTSTPGVVVGVGFEEPAPESSFKLLAKLSVRCVEAPDEYNELRDRLALVLVEFALARLLLLLLALLEFPLILCLLDWFGGKRAISSRYDVVKKIFLLLFLSVEGKERRL